MNDMIKSSIEPFLNGFDAFKVTNNELELKINNFKKNLLELSEKHNDVMLFFQEFASSGLQDEYGKLILEATNSSNSNNQNNNNSKTNKIVTVTEFIENYKEPYDEIKSQKYRKRAKKAYENLLNIPNRTDNILDAQIIIEKERLLYKIVSEDILDITEPIIEAMDPLQKDMTFTSEYLKNASINSENDEELKYRSTNNIIETAKFVGVWRVKNVIIPNALSFNLFLYLAKGKRWLWKWESDIIAMKGLENMLVAKSNIKNILKFSNENFNMTFEDICKNEASKIWLLNGMKVDELGKVKTSWSEENIPAFKEVINEEILKDLSIKDAILREASFEFKLSEISSSSENTYKQKAVILANNITKDLDYYKYKDVLNNNCNFLN